MGVSGCGVGCIMDMDMGMVPDAARACVVLVLDPYYTMYTVRDNDE